MDSDSSLDSAPGSGDDGEASSPPRSPSPNNRSQSPDNRSPSPDNRSASSGKRSPSPDNRSASSGKHSPSPENRSVSPDNRSVSSGNRSPSPENRSVSPDNRSVSSGNHSPSPGNRSASPDNRSASPDNRSVSPDNHSASTGNRSPSNDPKSPSSPPPRSPSPNAERVDDDESKSKQQIDSDMESVSADESGPDSPLPANDNPASPPMEDKGSSRSSSRSSSQSSQAEKSRSSVPDARDDDDDDGSYHSSDEEAQKEVKVEKKQEVFKPHSKEDLSDVSDLESQDGLGFDDDEDDKPTMSTKPADLSKAPQDALETELDFEAEEKEEKDGVDDKEDGECAPAVAPASEAGDGERSDGEVKDGDDLEEGECTDGDDARPEETEPRPICRFYNRGQCTWGSNCRFVHPGVTDKGNYTMFDMVRPLVPANGPPGYTDYRYDKIIPPGGFGFPAPGKEDPNAPPSETAWERGLRHAKEMMRKATKRKESDMDFEEKKMNLGLGQEELDKENDFYTRPASPVVARMEEPEYRHYEPEEEDYYRHPPPSTDQWRRVHYPSGGDSRAIRVETGSFDRMPHPEKYHRGPPSMPPEYSHHHEKRHRTLPRNLETPHEPKWRDRPSDDRPESARVSRYPESSSHRSRADEWSDPWMRSKSPPRKGVPTRRQSYSSGTSYSSSSRSSSRSSYSSYSSRSRSRSFSPGGPSPGPVGRHRRRSSPHRNMGGGHREQPPEPKPLRRGATEQRKGVPRKVPSGSMPDRKPPPPPGQPPVMRRKLEQPASPPPMQAPQKRPTTPPIPPDDLKPQNWSPAPAVPAKVPRGSKAARISKKLSRPRSSHSKSSGTDSDSASSSSSSSSLSSSSSTSSRNGTPAPQPKPAKRIVIDGREALANMVKIKALDALKVSGQKQQIKLTLKGSDGSNLPPGMTKKSLLEMGMASLGTSRKDQQLLASLSRKRPAETNLKRSSSPEGPGGSKGGASKKTPSRREELLKQLKAVEDAIRRKRFKVN